MSILQSLQLLKGGSSLAKADRIKSRIAVKQVINDTPIRRARTCYDHLAGVAGVIIFKMLIENNWLTLEKREKRDHYGLSTLGIQELTRRNVDLPKLEGTKRIVAYGCPDWTEDSDHLGGFLGLLILNSLEFSKFILRRSLRVVDVLKPLNTWLELNEE